MRTRTKISWLPLLMVLVALMLTACGGTDTGDGGAGEPAGTEEQGSEGTADDPNVMLNVSAEAGLTDALNEIYAAYQQESKNEISFNYAASETLQKQILAGAACDIFLSASKEDMDSLAGTNLIVPESRVDLLGNTLTLVAAAEKAGVVTMDNLASSDVKSIAIGDPDAVPAGHYAQQALESLGLWDGVQGKLLLALDSKQALESVETGAADCGLVYRSDTFGTEKGVVIGDLPAESHDPIVYPAALIAGSGNEDAASAFFSFLQTSYARGVFEKYGFTVL
ncbi:MAG: molybdate ABC transporter substrate-binding protein [Clostridiales Family XIII bacterium]|nr:molybdate ABC transporter substrate-binding protein [Clostridiales Family XIII bacterium]